MFTISELIQKVFPFPIKCITWTLFQTRHINLIQGKNFYVICLFKLCHFQQPFLILPKCIKIDRTAIVIIAWGYWPLPNWIPSLYDKLEAPSETTLTVVLPLRTAWAWTVKFKPFYFHYNLIFDYFWRTLFFQALDNLFVGLLARLLEGVCQL